MNHYPEIQLTEEKLARYAENCSLTLEEAKRFLLSELQGWINTGYYIFNGVRVLGGRNPNNGQIMELPHYE